MCIRDSIRTFDLQSYRRRLGIVSQSPFLFAGTVADNIRYACLLYTSDAADERSSVDLGGRRIIKKKKK